MSLNAPDTENPAHAAICLYACENATPLVERVVDETLRRERPAAAHLRTEDGRLIDVTSDRFVVVGISPFSTRAERHTFELCSCGQGIRRSGFLDVAILAQVAREVRGVTEDGEPYSLRETAQGVHVAVDAKARIIDVGETVRQIERQRSIARLSGLYWPARDFWAVLSPDMDADVKTALANSDILGLRLDVPLMESWCEASGFPLPRDAWMTLRGGSYRSIRAARAWRWRGR